MAAVAFRVTADLKWAAWLYILSRPYRWTPGNNHVADRPSRKPTAAAHRMSRAEGVRSIYLIALAALAGVISGLVAYVLYYLIAVTGNAVYFQKYDPHHLAQMQHNHFGLWVIAIPAIGGLIVGLMAKFGTEKIKGHGIPEAMEAVLTNKSRIAARVAVLKP